MIRRLIVGNIFKQKHIIQITILNNKQFNLIAIFMKIKKIL